MAIAGEVFRVSCRFKSTTAGDIVNVWHFKLAPAAAGTDEDVADDLEGFLDTFYSSLALYISSQVDPYDIRTDVVEMVGGIEKLVRAVRTKTWTLTSAPGGGSNATAPMDCPIVNLRTQVPRVFGRKYLPYLNQSNAYNGDVQSSALGDIATATSNLLGTLVGAAANYTMGVLSYKAGAGAGFWADVVGYVANALLGTQRRRRRNRGS